MLCTGKSNVQETSASSARDRLVSVPLEQPEDIYTVRWGRAAIRGDLELEQQDDAWLTLEPAVLNAVVQVLKDGSASRAAVLSGYPPSSSPVPAGGGGGSWARGVRAGLPAMHTMLTVQLSGHSSTGEDFQTAISFVELAAPEPKVNKGGVLLLYVPHMDLARNLPMGSAL